MKRVFTIPLNQSRSAQFSEESLLINNVKDTTHSIGLFGDPLKFPFDHYYLNIILLLPAGDIHVISQPALDRSVNALWNTTFYNNSNVDKFYVSDLLQRNLGPFATPPCIVSRDLIAEGSRPVYDAFCSNDNNSSFLNIRLDFNRNYSIYTILVPLLAVFYLLGAIFILGRDQVATRVTITFGIFAFLFTFTPIINQMKPITNVPTIADLLVTLILIATILFTISSIISYILQSEWVVDIVVVIGMIGYYIVSSYYSGIIKWWLIPIIVIGVAYGLIVRKLKPREQDINQLVDK